MIGQAILYFRCTGSLASEQIREIKELKDMKYNVWINNLSKGDNKSKDALKKANIEGISKSGLVDIINKSLSNIDTGFVTIAPYTTIPAGVN